MKVTKTILVAFLLQIFALLHCFAQKEANNWYFGNFAGITFKTGSPVALTNSMLKIHEGCASVSDTGGNLLFYTDGMSVINRNHITMPNGTGLLGDSSSTQSAIIVQKPGTSSIYYIFTTDYQTSYKGLNYSEVDMKLSGGLGAITSKKNIQLLSRTWEKLTAVRHANGIDLWVIAHEWNTNAFCSYLITSAGVNIVPVISNSGIANNHAIGYMKASPAGNRLAVACWHYNDLQLFDFDNSTGVVSNPFSLNRKFNFTGPYGVEFSQSGNMLYISQTNHQDNFKAIYQYDLTAPDIKLSEKIIDTFNTAGTGFGSVQLGPDGKIYIAIYHSDYLAVINKPEERGAACKYVRKAVSLAGRSAIMGLPTFYQSFFENKFTFNHTCKGDNTEFSILKTKFDSLKWDFGEPLSGGLNHASSANPSHVYSDTGEYSVKLVVFYNGYSKISSQNVRIMSSNLYLGNDTTLCLGETIQLNANNPNAYYLWQDSSKKANCKVSSPGMYKVRVSISNCIKYDSIIVSYDSLPKINLVNDTVLCVGKMLKLDVTHSNSSYRWQDGSKLSSFLVTQPGTYSVTLNHICGIVKDSINVSFLTTPSVSLGIDTTLCQGQILKLDAYNPGCSYLWQDGATTSSYNVSQPGNYWVKASNICGTATDDIKINYISKPPINLGNDTALCDGTTFKLDATTPNSSYFWPDGTTEPTFIADSTGFYYVQVTNDCGTITDSIFIRFDDCDCMIFVPNSFSPNNDDINDIFKPVTGCYFIEYKLLIFNRWGEKIFESNNVDRGWDGKYLNKASPDGQYLYFLQFRIDISGKKANKSGSLMLVK